MLCRRKLLFCDHYVGVLFFNVVIQSTHKFAESYAEPFPIERALFSFYTLVCLTIHIAEPTNLGHNSISHLIFHTLIFISELVTLRKLVSYFEMKSYHIFAYLSHPGIAAIFENNKLTARQVLADIRSLYGLWDSYCT